MCSYKLQQKIFYISALQVATKAIKTKMGKIRQQRNKEHKKLREKKNCQRIMVQQFDSR